MDYVIGSVAALVSGNVTPNRPRVLKRPLTPTKHQLSPNVTPKSELVDDRSIFLSPTLQKKKAIVKKSPKRIFQNNDLETTENCDTSTPSPKADKVKKHLKKELENNSGKSPKDNSSESSSKLDKASETNDCEQLNETPKKKKKKNKSKAQNNNQSIETPEDSQSEESSPKKLNKRRKSLIQSEPETNETEEIPQNSDKEELQTKPQTKKNKKRKKKGTLESNKENSTETNKTSEQSNTTIKKKNKKQIVNPNAITTQDSDSEHESDNEIKCQNEEINKKILNSDHESSSDEEEEVPEKKQEKVEKSETPSISTKDEIERTLFVGNVPYSKKCKKDIKKIFGKYGQIETIRIRTVPVKDGRYTPKMALVKNELHPDRSTVNVYIKYKSIQSVSEALAENNTVLNDHHLRVSRSDTTGSEHDPRLSVFIGNLPFALEDEVLRSKFENCGEIESVRIVRDKKTNAGKGFGYVNFKSKDGVELALKMSEDDLTIKNRILRVKRCTQQAQKGVKTNPGKLSKFYPQSKEKNFGNRQMGRQDRPMGRQDRQMGNRQGQGDRQRQGNQQDGAYRRVMNKRKSQESTEGPPNKKQNLNQPIKEKKTRKEFVGVTAEKKKKRKFDKGQKKKKAISEILTK